MSRGRLLAALILAVCLSSGTAPGPVRPPAALAGPLRQVVSGQITAFVPPDWDVRPLPAGVLPREGLSASTPATPRTDPAAARDVARRRMDPGLPDGLQAYWVNAAQVQVPSDYYYLAARGAAFQRPFDTKSCREEKRQVLADNRPVFDRRHYSAGDFVAVAVGTCHAGRVTTRWASFVAAPGYGPVRRLGIPESGLYYAVVGSPEGPRATKWVRDMLMKVSFGGTPVSEFIRVARSGHQP